MSGKPPVLDMSQLAGAAGFQIENGLNVFSSAMFPFMATSNFLNNLPQHTCPLGNEPFSSMNSTFLSNNNSSSHMSNNSIPQLQIQMGLDSKTGTEMRLKQERLITTVPQTQSQSQFLSAIKSENSKFQIKSDPSSSPSNKSVQFQLQGELSVNYQTSTPVGQSAPQQLLQLTPASPTVFPGLPALSDAAAHS